MSKTKRKHIKNKSLLSWYLVLIVALVAIDQAVKHWVTQNIPLNSSKTLIPGLLDLDNLHNTGAAWSMLEGRQWFFAIITVIAIIVVAWLMWKNKTAAWMMTGLSLIMAGAVGNFIDRLSQGYVVDMFALQNVNFPVFNVADACLTIGVFIMLIVVLKEDDHK
ncbi:signal peptidase II [Limosilactobacillus mucosae]|uniref:Lipoprotein signal peptidase n=1 Tax=Limosilactobacillus mucosae TaxID=97478 RepID=A0AAJ1HT62_LIMMU|nr:signal peptidase II [Limosilactobacillus mucosae]MDC2830017.1 signal peptidase II [Limosilactobacillus mucosae]MDC2837474.1 signal peptidase II [Limosilactobacillus mucosae]MDC2849695.1 signal peptidase II [Limosilactobacillus mucosae]MDC2853741.1 signal peptidase II [Limosilactobacillus mucosae]